MKVLTVRQPWAGAFFRADDPKTIENRTWRPPARGRIAIHAGMQRAMDVPAHLELPTFIPDRDFGVVLGTVEILSWHVECREECDAARCMDNPWAQWAEGNLRADPRVWHWRIGSPRAFVTPIKAGGRLGLWQPGPSLAHLIKIAEVRP